MVALHPHVEMIFNRHLVIEFGVADFRRHLTVLHLKNANVLHVGLAVEVVLLDAGRHTFHIPFTAGYIKSIAEQNAVDGRGGAHLDVDPVLYFSQAFQAPDRLIFFLLGHQPVMLLEVFLPAQR